MEAHRWGVICPGSKGRVRTQVPWLLGPQLPLTPFQLIGSFFHQLYKLIPHACHVRGLSRICEHSPFSVCRETSWIRDNPSKHKQANKQFLKSLRRSLSYAPARVSSQMPMCNSHGSPTPFIHPHPHTHPSIPIPIPVVFEPGQRNTQGSSSPQHITGALVWFPDPQDSVWYGRDISSSSGPGAQ